MAILETLIGPIAAIIDKVIPDKDAKVDRRNIGRMIVPGIFFLESMFAPAGAGAGNA